jgi:hypothetical protein
MVCCRFADVSWVDYIRMAAFYELRMHVIEQTFICGYVKSVVRDPGGYAHRCLDVAAVAGRQDFVNTGRKPADPRALVFWVADAVRAASAA